MNLNGFILPIPALIKYYELNTSSFILPIDGLILPWFLHPKKNIACIATIPKPASMPCCRLSRVRAPSAAASKALKAISRLSCFSTKAPGDNEGGTGGKCQVHQSMKGVAVGENRGVRWFVRKSKGQDHLTRSEVLMEMIEFCHQILLYTP